ncbi:hypothetical protein C1H76_2287 [Elsinoe australis]|uniref:Uncharacterized protein n=1 Tax=Elsinoe australis TaxID=40998 RepID=A0A4U7BCJ7_9PEZI|nr:hypothetical protein C1H76_2287 [Elsinoe australis]
MTTNIMRARRNPLHFCTKAYRLRLPAQSHDLPFLQDGNLHLCKDFLYCYTDIDSNKFICDYVSPPAILQANDTSNIMWGRREVDPETYASELSGLVNGIYGENVANSFREHILKNEGVEQTQRDTTPPEPEPQPEPELEAAAPFAESYTDEYEVRYQPEIVSADPYELVWQYKPIETLPQPAETVTSAPPIPTTSWQTIWAWISWPFVWSKSILVKFNMDVDSTWPWMSWVAFLAGLLVAYCFLNEYRCKVYEINNPERVYRHKPARPKGLRPPTFQEIYQSWFQLTGVRDYVEQPLRIPEAPPTAGQTVLAAIVMFSLPWITVLSYLWHRVTFWTAEIWDLASNSRAFGESIQATEKKAIGLRMNTKMTWQGIKSVFVTAFHFLESYVLEPSANSVSPTINFYHYVKRGEVREWVQNRIFRWILFSILVLFGGIFLISGQYIVRGWWDWTAEGVSDGWAELPSLGEAGAGVKNWFGPRSMVMVTTTATDVRTTSVYRTSTVHHTHTAVRDVTVTLTTTATVKQHCDHTRAVKTVTVAVGGENVTTLAGDAPEVGGEEKPRAYLVEEGKWTYCKTCRQKHCCEFAMH